MIIKQWTGTGVFTMDWYWYVHNGLVLVCSQWTGTGVFTM